MDDFRQMISFDELTSDDTIALARTAAGAIRGLNHATGCDAGLGQPAVAYDVLGALSLATSRLPQLIGQVTAWLDRALAAGRLGHDLGEDPSLAIDTAAALAGDLDGAWQQLTLVNGNPDTPRRKDHS